MGYLDAFSEDVKRKSRKLVDLEIDEISLVQRAASGKKFAVIKGALPDDLPQEITDFLGEQGELEDDIEGARQAVADAVKKLAPFMIDFPTDLGDAVRKLAAWASAAAYAPEEPPRAEPTQKKRREVEKGSPLWPSLGTLVRGRFVPPDPSEDVGPGDTDAKPPRRAISKGLKGQDDLADDSRSENPWPSLSGR